MSAIFYHNEEQKKEAEESMKAESKKRSKTIQTKILPIGTFYLAEDYHQKYLLQRYPYILSQLDVEPGDELINSYVCGRLNGYVGGYGSLKAFDEELSKLDLSPKVEQFVRRIVASGKGAGVDC